MKKDAQSATRHRSYGKQNKQTNKTDKPIDRDVHDVVVRTSMTRRVKKCEASWQKLLLSYISRALIHLTSVGSRKKEAEPSYRDTPMTTIIMAVKENLKEKELQRRKDTTSATCIPATCIPLSYLCGDFLLHLFSHCSRATAAATSQQSSQEDIRRGEEEKEETSREETTTSSSHLEVAMQYQHRCSTTPRPLLPRPVYILWRRQ